MRILIQRVSRASVSILGEIFSEIGAGLLVFLGVEHADNEKDIEYLAQKLVNLRIFPDENGVMNLSVLDVKGEVLVVSQFTLHARTRKGNRPSYIDAAKPETSIPLYEKFCVEVEKLLNKPVRSGEFGADMQVELINDGPVTIWMDSKNPL
ncbi:MAG: D-tyrosyl-tRNA(Tyr) deacylase [Porphyromonadaceae bacterium]|nr:D-tyrosyl-tRNA(Tyr) deacylase [Porphyromonadaceae bacterium]